MSFFKKPKRISRRERSREKDKKEKKEKEGNLNSKEENKVMNINGGPNTSNSGTVTGYQRPYKRDLCKYFLNGVCTRGDNCTFSHIIKDFPCKYFVTLGNCDNKECR